MTALPRRAPRLPRPGKDRKKLKAALDAAEDLDLNLTAMDAVKKKLKALDKEHRDKQQAALEDGDDAGPVTDKSADELTKARDEQENGAS